MPTFCATGTTPDDLWLVDTSPDFSILPANTIKGITIDLPIWLKVGTRAYGAEHIAYRHGHWVQKQGKSVPELVHFKLGQGGTIYSTEEDAKVKISMRLAPDSLLILNIYEHTQTPHISVTSLYAFPRNLDGQRLGKYLGR